MKEAQWNSLVETRPPTLLSSFLHIIPYEVSNHCRNQLNNQCNLSCLFPLLNALSSTFYNALTLIVVHEFSSCLKKDQINFRLLSGDFFHFHLFFEFLVCPTYHTLFCLGDFCSFSFVLLVKWRSHGM